MVFINGRSVSLDRFTCNDADDSDIVSSKTYSWFNYVFQKDAIRYIVQSGSDDIALKLKFFFSFKGRYILSSQVGSSTASGSPQNLGILEKSIENDPLVG